MMVIGRSRFGPHFRGYNASLRTSLHMPSGVQLVPYSQFSRGFRGAFVVPKENNVDIGVQPSPGPHRVALDDPDVLAERFRGSEEG
jgi:hypothetical protein